MNDSWYDVVEASAPLTQGDLVFGCPISTWAEEDNFSDGSTDPSDVAPLAVDPEEYLKKRTKVYATDVIVMTQACDLAHGKISDVVVCLHFPLSVFREEVWKAQQLQRKQKANQEVWEKYFNALSNGFVWNLCVLNSSTIAGHPLEHRVVDFHKIYTIPRDFLEAILRRQAGPRFQLRPPYREHLSQAFARFFMRVGLPQNLNKPS